MKVKRRKFGEDNVVRTQDGEVMILPSYDPDNPYPFYQREYFPLREDGFDYYDPISGQIVLADGGILSPAGKFSETVAQGIVTHEEIDWLRLHFKWIILGLIGIGTLLMLRPRRREIVEVQSASEVV